MILVNDAKYIHLLTQLFDFLEPFHIASMRIHNSFEFFLFCYKHRLSYLLATEYYSSILHYTIRIIVYSTKYVQKLFKVDCLRQPTAVAYIAWLRMKSCSKLLRITFCSF